MRLIFYVFLICQLFNFLSVFAEKVKENSSELNPIQWEKVKEDKSNSQKKIIWETYKENNYSQEDHQEDKDNIYSQEDHQEDKVSKKNRNFFNENNLENFGGLTVDNSILLRSGESNMNFDYDSLGNLLGSYSYSFSNIFQLNLINAGNFRVKNNAIRKNSELTNIFLGDNNLHYRVGGKLLFFSPESSDLLSISSRVSFGSELNSRQSYTYTDFTNTIKLNNWISFNISPKYIFSGVGNLGAIGLSNKLRLSNKLQFISETNLGITKDSSDNSSFSLRFSYSPANSIDLFATNSVGFQDIGTMLSTKNYKFGIKSAM